VRPEVRAGPSEENPPGLLRAGKKFAECYEAKSAFADRVTAEPYEQGGRSASIFDQAFSDFPNGRSSLSIFDRIGWLRLTLLTGQLLEIDLIERPDSFSQVVDKFENGDRLLGCPVRGDWERNGEREAGGTRCSGMIRIECTSLAKMTSFHSPAFDHVFLGVLFYLAANLDSVAENRVARVASSGGRSAIAVGWSCPAMTVRRPLPLGLRAGDHRIGPMRNSDASRYFCAPDSDVPVLHGCCGRGGSSDNGDRKRAATVGVLSERRFRCNRHDRDHSGCRSAPGLDSRGTQTAAPTFHWLGPGNSRERMQP
jgi:hypothetical protein